MVDSNDVLKLVNNNAGVLSPELRLFLIEDNPGDADLIGDMLEANGIAPARLERAVRLSEAVEQLKKQPVEAIILDLGLPDSAGLDTLRAVRAATRDAAIIVLTGDDSEEAGVAAVMEGAEEYLVKGRVDGRLLVRELRYAIERQRNKRQILESERFLRASMDALAGHIAILDESGKILFVNKAWREFAAANDMDPAQVDEGADYFAVCDGAKGEDAEMAKRFVEGIREVLAGNSDFFEMEYPCHSPDEQRWFIGRVTEFSGEGPRRAAVVHENISARKRAEEALRDSEERYRTILLATMDGFWMVDMQGRLLEVNAAYCRMSGYSEAELLAMRISDLDVIETREDTARHIHKTMAQSEDRFETGHRRKDGSIFDVEISTQYHPFESGRLVVFLHDITERKRAERERETLEEQYRQAQKMEAVGQLAGGVAHDFNNILQAMVGYSSMLLDRLPQHDETHEFAEEIAHSAERAAALTRQLLAFSRRQILEMKDLDLNDVVLGLTKMMRRVIGEDVEVDVVEGCGLGIVHADRGQMEQVLLNLCINARDAMPEGGALTIETENVEMDIEYCEAHAWASPGRYALLSVTDTGCGMDAETQARIFEPFFTTKELGKGTGLGLATVYGIVRQHQGMIQVYSEMEKGTRFKIYLPSVERSASTAGTVAVERARGGTETILVAEDDEPLRKLAVRILESAGYTVLLAADGKEALDVFEKHAADLDLILLDVVMPKMGGKAVYDDLRQQHPRLRFLFSSGYSTNAIHTGFVLHEGIELIQKPYAPDTLLRKVRDVLDQPEVDPIPESNQRQRATPVLIGK